MFWAPWLRGETFQLPPIRYSFPHRKGSGAGVVCSQPSTGPHEVTGGSPQRAEQGAGLGRQWYMGTAPIH